MTTATKTIVNGPIDSNVFAIVGACTVALRKDGKKTEAKELATTVFNCESYDEALVLCQKYVTFQNL